MDNGGNDDKNIPTTINGHPESHENVPHQYTSTTTRKTTTVSSTPQDKKSRHICNTLPITRYHV